MSEGDPVTRGERGPAGDKGAHGQAGDPGLTGGIGERGDRGQKGERGDTGARGIEGKSTLLSRNVSLSYLVLTIVAFVVLAVMSYALYENRQLAQDLERVALNNCEAIETLKASERAAALLSFSRLDETLRFLGIEKTPAVEDAALRSRDEKLEQFKARDCRVPPP